MPLQQRRLHLEIEDIGDITAVKLLDKEILDEQTIQSVGDQLFRLVDEQGKRKLLLNFGNVQKMSSAALGKMAALNKKLKNLKGKLVLCSITPLIYEAFQITNLHTVIDIQQDEQAALQSF